VRQAILPTNDANGQRNPLASKINNTSYFIKITALGILAEGGNMTKGIIRPHVVYSEHHEVVENVGWSFDGQYIASIDREGIVHIWDPRTGRTHFVHKKQKDENGAIRSFAWSPQEHLFASGDENGYIQICDALQGDIRANYAIHNCSVSVLAWSPNARTIISACSEGLHLWDASSGQDYWNRIGGEADQVNTCTWSPENHFVATSNGGTTIPVWKASDGECVQLLSSIGEVRSIAWSPDGTKIAGAGWGIELWDAYSGNLIKTLGMRHMIVQQAQWSPDSKYLALCFHFPARHEVTVFEIETGRQIVGYSKHKGKVLAISWAPNGQDIATASADGTVHIWNIPQQPHLPTKIS
jgi:WD40 repeat protein